MSDPRGGHATVLLGDGRILITGGAERAGGASTSTIFVSAGGGGAFVRQDFELSVPRSGHTTLPLPDGRVMVIGGSRSEDVRSVDDLVEDVEIIDLQASTSEIIRFEGAPIRRAYHTASLRQTSQRLLIDLHGGRGDIRYRPEPRLGIRDDLRSFLLEGDALISQSPAIGPFLTEPIAGHTLTRLSPAAGIEPTQFLVHGSHFSGSQIQSVSLTVDFANELGIVPTQTGATFLPRTRHAATAIREGLVLLHGGQSASTELETRIELFVAQSNSFLTFPSPQPLSPLPRYGHTATKLDAGRILYVGGFSASGVAIRTSEHLLLHR